MSGAIERDTRPAAQTPLVCFSQKGMRSEQLAQALPERVTAEPRIWFGFAANADATDAPRFGSIVRMWVALEGRPPVMFSETPDQDTATACVLDLLGDDCIDAAIMAHNECDANGVPRDLKNRIREAARAAQAVPGKGHGRLNHPALRPVVKALGRLLCFRPTDEEPTVMAADAMPVLLLTKDADEATITAAVDALAEARKSHMQARAARAFRWLVSHTNDASAELLKSWGANF